MCVCMQLQPPPTNCGDSPQMLSHSANTELERNGSRTFPYLIAIVINIMFPKVVSEDYASI